MITFAPKWNGDRRITGFSLMFLVDALDWDLWEMFRTAVKKGTQFDWPNLTDPIVARQKDWEGDILASQLWQSQYGSVDDIIKCLRKGGNPFWKIEDKTLDQHLEDEAVRLMNALRDAVGPELGWHSRIVPLQTAEGLQILTEKSALESSAAKVVAPKKSLKSRTDIM